MSARRTRPGPDDFAEAERIGRAAGLARLREMTATDGIHELVQMAAVAERFAPAGDAGVRRARALAHAEKLAAAERTARALRALRR